MPSLTYLLSCMMVVLAGAAVAVQQVLNADLRAQIGSPWWAGTVSYVVGLAAMLAVALLTPWPRLGAGAAGHGAWLSWTGGVLGAIFIATAIFMVPRLGAATTLALIVVGQMLASLLLDHYGALGLAQQPVTVLRLAGAACLILGVVMIRS